MKKVVYMTFVALFMAFGMAAQTSSTPSVSEAPITKHTISRVMEKTINGKKWELTLNDDVVTDVKLNGKKLPKSAWAKYQKEIDDLRTSAYDMDPEVKKTDSGIVIKDQEAIQPAELDLSPEQKATQKAIEDELLSDKLIGETGYRLVLTEKKMEINGKMMPQATLDKYVDIYFKNSGEERCQGCKFTFQMNKKSN